MKRKSRAPVTPKSELRREVSELRSIGTQMSNLCFNLSQRNEGRPQDRQAMNELYREWDAIKRAEQPRT